MVLKAFVQNVAMVIQIHQDMLNYRQDGAELNV